MKKARKTAYEARSPLKKLEATPVTERLHGILNSTRKTGGLREISGTSLSSLLKFLNFSKWFQTFFFLPIFLFKTKIT